MSAHSPSTLAIREGATLQATDILFLKHRVLLLCSDPRVAASAQEDLKARRRMLGNIQFIGELFKEKMLTEKIMHECIVKLLGEASAVCPSASSSQPCGCPLNATCCTTLAFSIITNILCSSRSKLGSKPCCRSFVVRLQYQGRLQCQLMDMYSLRSGAKPITHSSSHLPGRARDGGARGQS